MGSGRRGGPSSRPASVSRAGRTDGAPRIPGRGRSLAARGACTIDGLACLRCIARSAARSGPEREPRVRSRPCRRDSARPDGTFATRSRRPARGRHLPIAPAMDLHVANPRSPQTRPGHTRARRHHRGGSAASVTTSRGWRDCRGSAGTDGAARTLDPACATRTVPPRAPPRTRVTRCDRLMSSSPVTPRTDGALGRHARPAASCTRLAASRAPQADNCAMALDRRVISSSTRAGSPATTSTWFAPYSSSESFPSATAMLAS